MQRDVGIGAEMKGPILQVFDHNPLCVITVCIGTICGANYSDRYINRIKNVLGKNYGRLGVGSSLCKMNISGCMYKAGGGREITRHTTESSALTGRLQIEFAKRLSRMRNR